MFGFLNIYKPKGITSHDVVSKLRRITKIKQIGHTGTLDPFAQGVLPICIGKSTRLIEYLNDDKEYLATLNFGKTTDTYDIDGEITSSSAQKVTKEQIIDGLKIFTGEIIQTPPVYSAIKVKGKKLYEYAREGKAVEISPRKVTIYKTVLENFDETNQTAQIRIACSKGTYIRSIAHDLGQNLGCGAFLSELVRTKAGKFEIENSVKLEYILSFDEVQKNLINPLDMLELPQLKLDEKDYKKILQGQFIVNKSVQNNSFLILIYNENICAVAFVENSIIKVKKVFS